MPTSHDLGWLWTALGFRGLRRFWLKKLLVWPPPQKKLTTNEPPLENRYKYLEPKWAPCFDWRPSFGGFNPQNKGQTGSRYILNMFGRGSFPFGSLCPLEKGRTVRVVGFWEWSCVMIILLIWCRVSSRWKMNGTVHIHWDLNWKVQAFTVRKAWLLIPQFTNPKNVQRRVTRSLCC